MQEGRHVRAGQAVRRLPSAPRAAHPTDANYNSQRRAKDDATSQGGTIGHDYNLIKGFS